MIVVCKHGPTKGSKGGGLGSKGEFIEGPRVEDLVGPLGAQVQGRPHLKARLLACWFAFLLVHFCVEGTAAKHT